MVQTRTTDGGNSLRRHWLHGKRTNGRTGTAQRYPNGILNHSQLYANYKTRLVPEAPAGYPPPTLLPLSGGSNPWRGIFCVFTTSLQGQTALSARQRPPLRQKKPAAFRFRRGGENSISAASFFLSKPEPFHWVPVWLTNGGCRRRRLGEFLNPFFSFSARKKEWVQSSKKRKRPGANRCPESDSENFGLKPSVPSAPTSRKVSALCASPFGGTAT